MSNYIKGIPKDSRQYLASFINRNGKRRTIKAFYARQYEIESDSDSCQEVNDEYNEDNDCYYLIEGWYEVIENWAEYSSICVSEGEVTHYQTLPEHPNDNNVSEKFDNADDLIASLNKKD